MKLSDHFTLAEMTHSDYAVRTGTPNKPGTAELANLFRLAQTLERVRIAVGKPLIINSAYRSPSVNSAIGGAHNSQHMRGLAADVKVLGMTPYEVCQRVIRAGIEYDQLILEFGSWTHISVPEVTSPARGDQLTYRAGKPVERGIVA